MRICCMETSEYGIFTLTIIAHHIDCMIYTIHIIVDKSKTGMGTPNAVKYHGITIFHNLKSILISNEMMD